MSRAALEPLATRASGRSSKVEDRLCLHRRLDEGERSSPAGKSGGEGNTVRTRTRPGLSLWVDPRYWGVSTKCRGSDRGPETAQRELGADRFLAINMARLADVEVQMGELDAAEGHYRESLAKVAEAGNVVITAIMLVYLAWVAGRRSEHRRAARLLGPASRIRDEAGSGPTRDTILVLPEAEDEARQALGDEAFEGIRAEGYAMSVDEAVRSALEAQVEGGPDG